MERFKVIEKEMKTKAYSKEGLGTAVRIDAKEQQRIDLTQWIADKVEELQRQVEGAEAEAESLQAGAKKKGKAGEAGQARIELLELQNERRQWHISQLEIIMRLLENSSLKVEDVESVKEDVDFFVSMNAVSNIPKYIRSLYSSYVFFRKKILIMMKEFMRNSIWTTSWNRTWTTRVTRSLKRSQKVLQSVLAYFGHLLLPIFRSSTTNPDEEEEA